MRCWIVPLITSGLAFGQTFEVASVKPSGPQSVRGWEGGPGSPDPGRYVWGAATIQDLIVTAYDLQYFQVSSKLAIDRDRYDLIAKVPEGATKEQLRTMLQNLLAERFRLKTHK